MARVLSAKECETQYIKTLDKLAQTSIFQYTFIATMYYFSAYTSPLEETTFLGFKFSKLEWVIVALSGNIILGVYLTRQIHYLTLLLRIYPSQRRKLKFLTWHHFWLFNPFHTAYIGNLPKRLKGTKFYIFKLGKLKVSMHNAYLGIVYSPTLYLMIALTDWWDAAPVVKGATSLERYLAIFLISIPFVINFFVTVHLVSAMHRHNEAMWQMRLDERDWEWIWLWIKLKFKGHI